MQRRLSGTWGSDVCPASAQATGGLQRPQRHDEARLTREPPSYHTVLSLPAKHIGGDNTVRPHTRPGPLLVAARRLLAPSLPQAALLSLTVHA